MRAPLSAAAGLLLLSLAACSAEEEPPPTQPPTGAAPSISGPAPEPGNADIVAAATAFLGTLDDGERDDVLFDRGDRAQQQRWSNLPDQFFQRDGLMIGDLDQGKVDAFLAVMRATLSTEGYDRVMAQWAADDEMPGGRFGREFFWIAIIGEPSATEPWQWQFGGHHVTINATVRGDALSLTPSFIGAQPATYSSGGTTVRPLGDIVDQAFALVNTVDDAAVLGNSPVDLVLGVGQDCRTVAPEGLAGSAMTDSQRAALLELIGAYGGLVNDRHAATRMAQLEEDLPETRFAWYGPTTAGSAAYFRITGPRVVIEYSPQAMGGDAANHIHGIYRDPANDYGGTVC